MAAVFRTLSSAAVYLRKRAIDLATKLRGSGVINEIHELFILRAVGAGPNTIVTALEVPPKFGGGFGGPSAGLDFFVAGLSAEYGQTFSALFKPSFRLVDELPAPTLTEEFKAEVPNGGRVPIGSPPPWTDPRLALNATVGQFYVYPSAVMLAVCPTYDTTPNPDARTLLVARVNGYMPMVGLTAGMVSTGRPAVNGDDHTGRQEAIGVIEFSRAGLGGTSDDLLREASACLEWGPLNGIASVEISRGVAARFALVGYTIADNGVGETPRYTGAVAWQTDLDAGSLPALDQPEGLPASGAVAPGYNFPGWATSNGYVSGKAAADGAFFFPDAANCRMWAPSAGYAVPPESTMMILQVVSGLNAADFNVEAWTGDPGTPTYAFFDVPAHQAERYITYVVNISAAGALSFVKLSEFTYSRYDPAFFGELQRVDYRPYLGVNTLDGTPRLICSKLTNHYDILPAEPDVTGPPRVMGELERKVLNQFNAYVRLNDLSFVFVAANGAETALQLGVYYPVLYTIDTGPVGVAPAPTDGRPGFANTKLPSVEPRQAQSIPAPFCQYAPGIVACLLSPKTDYTSSVHTLRVGLFDVTTGVMTHLSPALLGYVTRTRFNLSCYEQGTVDEGGVLLSHGRLYLMASTSDNSVTRGDGFFAINDLATVTWISREPSNTPMHYIGNRLVPSTIGVSTNLIGVKPTPIPE